MSITDMILAAIVVGLGAAGTYLLLPHKHGTARPRAAARGRGGRGRAWGCWCSSPSGARRARSWPTVFLYVFGVTAIIGGLLTVTSRNPVYSALWFASVVLSTAGLFLLAERRSSPRGRSSSMPARSSSRSCS